MQGRSLVCSLVMLFSLFCFIFVLDASMPTSDVSFHGGGLIVSLAFPEEAHPAESIIHNLTITAKASLTLENFTIVINAFVGSSWQQAYKEQILLQDMLQNESLSRQNRFTLPQNTHGRLNCFMHILTDRVSDYLSYSFYTTEVRVSTYGELLVQYNKLLANYTNLLADYEMLLESYNELSVEHSTLNSTYNSLLHEYNTLRSTYNSLNSTYYGLQASHDSLSSSYDSLSTEYNSLNQTYVALENEINNLLQQIEASRTELNNTRNLIYLFVGTTVALIALVIYIRKKRKEPYIVIRKETVAVKQNDKS